MKKPMMFAYLLHLSHNMWGDEGSDMRFSPWYPTMDALHYPTWRQTIEALPQNGFNTLLIDVGDALQYESHPDVAIPGAWDKDFMKKELDYIRSLGITPLPKLNFSCGHDAWLKTYSRMGGTQEYRQVCQDLIQEVAEVFEGPEYFHLGMDEEGDAYQSRMQFQCVRRGDLLWNDYYHMFKACESVGATPWVWSDMHWHHPKEFIEKMPKSVLQSPWNYSAMGTLPSKSEPDKKLECKHDPATLSETDFQYVYDHSMVELDQAGFTLVPTGSNYTCRENTERIFEASRDYLDPQHLRGLMTAPWHNTMETEQYFLLDCALRFGRAKEKYFPNEG